MLRRRMMLSKISLFLVFFLFCLSFNLSTVETSSSNSLGSVTPSISQSYYEHEPVVINNDNDLDILTDEGDGSANNPYILANWNITGSASYGISIRHTTKHFRIENCWVSNSNQYGIRVYNVPSNTVTIVNNTCNNNAYTGILIMESDYSTIANNTCNNNGHDGIHLYYSEFSTVANNTCNNNADSGIVFNFESSFVTNNICNNNVIGIFIRNSESVIITNNTCSGNRASGISFANSDDNSVVWNTLVNNGHGIVLNSYSDKNNIHHNSFITSRFKAQAYDAGTNNQWYGKTVLEGNIWSDYNGTGCYLIAGGSAGAKDLYPSNLTGTYVVNVICSFSKPVLTPAFTYIAVFLAFGLFSFFRKYKNIFKYYMYRNTIQKKS